MQLIPKMGLAQHAKPRWIKMPLTCKGQNLINIKKQFVYIHYFFSYFVYFIAPSLLLNIFLNDHIKNYIYMKVFLFGLQSQIRDYPLCGLEWRLLHWRSISFYCIHQLVMQRGAYLQAKRPLHSCKL